MDLPPCGTPYSPWTCLIAEYPFFEIIILVIYRGILSKSKAYLEHILVKSVAHILHVLGISSAYLWHNLVYHGSILGISWACLGHILDRSWAYHVYMFQNILVMYMGYLLHIFGMSWANLGNIFDISMAYLWKKLGMFQWWANIIKWTQMNIQIYLDATLCTKRISKQIRMPHIYQTNIQIHSNAGNSTNISTNNIWG